MGRGRLPPQTPQLTPQVSGCDTPTDVARLAAALAPIFPRPVEVMNDALILSLVMRERRAEWCAAVVSGTGSVALGVDSTGQWGKRGGFGFLFGDPGSGYHLGLVAIRRACEAYDEGREVDGVARLIRERFGAESTDDVPARCVRGLLGLTGTLADARSTTSRPTLTPCPRATRASCALLGWRLKCSPAQGVTSSPQPRWRSALPA